jgi:alkyl sulfatase BDS1-like metallo-beta-lactamase superfamily hydrolase
VTNPYDVERSWPDYFLEHRKLFEEDGGQGTYKCGDLPVWTVHAPLGFIGNSTFIVGDDGVIVYDTGIGAESGALIAAEIRKVTDLPIKAIFYSHHHTDHYNGTASIVDQAAVDAGEVAIYAWENFVAEMDNEFGEILNRQAMGVAYYGGALLPPEEKHHHGIGLDVLGQSGGYIPPTTLLSGDTQLIIAGVTLKVFYTGGEAISEFGIHIPEFDMVIIADEFFSGYPNMHSIRGSKPRLPENYTTALARVIDIEPEWLLGSHIIPMQGKADIVETVTRYRDATQYLWDQSIRLINKGYTPVELQYALKDMPEHLVQPPFSVATYGTPFTTVPEFFTGWVSWFSGDATDMLPSPPAHKAKAYVTLMGGTAKVLHAAKQEHALGDHQLAAELAQLALRAEPDSEDARLLKAAALRARGYQELNPIARSWYLSGAMELEGRVDPDQVLKGALKTFEGTDRSAAQIVGTWRYRLDAEAAGDTRLVVGIKADSGEELTARLRNSILLIEEGLAADVDAVVEADLAALAQPVGASVSAVRGDASDFERLVSFLDLEVHGFKMHQR